MCMNSCAPIYVYVCVCVPMPSVCDSGILKGVDRSGRLMCVRIRVYVLKCKSVCVPVPKVYQVKCAPSQVYLVKCEVDIVRSQV